VESSPSRVRRSSTSCPRPSATTWRSPPAAAPPTSPWRSPGSASRPGCWRGSPTTCSAAACAATEQTSLAIVAVDPDGDPSYDFRIAGTADWQWTPDELAGALDGPVVALHSGSLALTTAPGAAVLRELIAKAAESVTISYDPNCRPLLMGDPADVLAGVHELLAVADVVKVSAEDLGWLVPGSPPDAVLDDWLGRGPAVVAVTLGGDGVIAGTAGGVRSRRPSVPVMVVDTVGAGDTFSAALLAGLHRLDLLGATARPALRTITPETLDALLDEAALAAAITCSRRGADPPTLDDLRARRA
jgi:fructokinase